MSNSEIIVSVVVAVYNHEKFVKQAIESILMQKTSFKIEVLIGEDCSTDNSRQILKRIEKDCPQYFHFFYRETNFGASKNFNDLYKRMKGKYFIVLEGDDYWSYEYKLQKQVEFLEAHSDYLACSHLVKVVDKESVEVNIDYPDCRDEEYSIAHFRKGILPGHTSSNLYRNFYQDKIIDISLLDIPFTAGDRKKAFVVICQGKIHCIQEYWSCYRYITTGGASFSANNKWSLDKLKIVQGFYWEMILFAKSINNKEAILAAEELYYQSLVSEIIHQKSIFSVILFIRKFFICINKRKIVAFLLSKRKKEAYPK